MFLDENKMPQVKIVGEIGSGSVNVLRVFDGLSLVFALQPYCNKNAWLHPTINQSSNWFHL